MPASSRIVTTDNIIEGEQNKYYTEPRFDNSFNGKAGDAEDLSSEDTDNRSWSAKTLMDFIKGKGTFEKDANGDYMPREDPQPSLLWDIDANGDIMPSKMYFALDDGGDVMPI